MKENATPVAVQTPSVVRTAPPNVDRQTVSPTPMPPATESSAPAASATEISNSAEAEADGRSIYIKNLPLTATAGQLDEEFRKFGSIKAGGIQVRSNKASPITIGGRQAYVEEKRPAGNRVPRGRFPPGRGGFRNDGMRGGRGGYGGRGYGRNDFTNRGDFSNRGRGSASGRGGTTEGYQRVDQIGNGSRGARASAGNQMSRSGQRVGSVTA